MQGDFQTNRIHPLSFFRYLIWGICFNRLAIASTLTHLAGVKDKTGADVCVQWGRGGGEDGK